MDNENIIKEEVSQNEQITMIKKNLTEWCKKQSNGNITDFGDRIEIVEICKSGIIKFDIKTRYVRRELEERKTTIVKQLNIIIKYQFLSQLGLMFQAIITMNYCLLMKVKDNY